jgi:hypothetical protein
MDEIIEKLKTKINSSFHHNISFGDINSFVVPLEYMIFCNCFKNIYFEIPDCLEVFPWHICTYKSNLKLIRANEYRLLILSITSEFSVNPENLELWGNDVFGNLLCWIKTCSKRDWEVAIVDIERSVIEATKLNTLEFILNLFEYKTPISIWDDILSTGDSRIICQHQ